MEVFPEERKRYILDQLEQSPKVRVTEISRKFSVSTETVRRDLGELEGEGLLKRVYGGAIKTNDQSEPPLLSRQQVKATEKEKIAKSAAALIKDDSTILLDVGTTVLQLAKEIKDKRNITILTNSFLAAGALMENIDKDYFSGTVILLGGQLDPRQYSMTGKVAEMVLEQFTVDQAFISVGGISLENGLSDFDFDECMISKKMIEAAKEVVVLADGSKLGTNTFCKFGALEDVDIVVSEVAMPASWQGNEKFRTVEWMTTRD
ncbi:DeoR/GlpR family DNA-binding transcription regulator [Salinicoccus sesuvii]|uniref:DeoR/GlpR family DNA-binding transcription regulator n=1 Tax=Salinicoccus sesuvii TaxID=868281 RepID=A0ABV7N646_9STAP